ncbi:hypothetical protein WJX84_009666 [Apatococcus fuscideae]|uniref:Uncharacterized protein n=1 Tax=Apatococcus fuscideae TaxID=2026836 RepID=A0AAW1SNY6_9CHLO
MTTREAVGSYCPSWGSQDLAGGGAVSQALIFSTHHLTMPPDYAFHLGLYSIPPLQPGEDENVLLPLPPLVTRLRLEAERRNTGNPSGLQHARRVTWYRLEGKLKVQDYYAGRPALCYGSFSSSTL